MSTFFSDVYVRSIDGQPFPGGVGTLKAGDVVQIVVEAYNVVGSSAVTVAQGSIVETYSGTQPDAAHKKTVYSGWPALRLANGALATYDPGQSDPATGTLVFDYTVQPGDTGTLINGNSPVSIDLTPHPDRAVNGTVPSATILDASGNAVVGGSFLFPSSYVSLDVDTTLPSVQSIMLDSPNNAGYTNASEVDFVVTFSKAVTGVTASDFTLVDDQHAAIRAQLATITSVTQDSSNPDAYHVTVDTHGQNVPNIQLEISAPDAITDLAGHRLPGGLLSTGSAVVADNGPAQLGSPIPNAQLLEVADLNGDGLQDIVSGGIVRLNSTSGYGVGTQLSFSGTVASTTLADINGDGILDIVVGYDGTARGSYDPYARGAYFIGNGDGTFQAERDFSAKEQTLSAVQSTPSYPQYGPFTATIDPTHKTVTINYATTSATLALAGTPMNVAFGTGANNETVYVFYDDGATFSTLIRDPHSLSYTQQEELTYRLQTPLTQLNNPDLTSIAVGDLSGDGTPDIVAVDRTNSDGVYLRGDGSAFTGTTSNPIVGGKDPYSYSTAFATGTAPTNIGIADLNQDGRQDIILTSGGGVFGYFTSGVGQGDPSTGQGQFSAYGFATNPNLMVVTSLEAKTTPADTGQQVATLSTDGYLTIFSNDPSKNLLSTSSGAAQYSIAAQLGSGARPVALLAADMNGDGVEDLVVITSQGNAVTFYGSYTDSTHRTWAPLATSTVALRGLAGGSVPLTQVNASIADVDGDGRPDLVYNGVSGLDLATYVSYNIGGPLIGGASYHIDQDKPATPIISTLVSDSGTQGNVATNLSRLEFAGGAEPYSLVTLTVVQQDTGTTVSGSAYADSNGNFDVVVPSNVSDGIYFASATATDAAGNVSTTGYFPHQVVVESSPPVLTSLTQIDSAVHTPGTVHYHAVFSEAVTALTPQDFQVVTGGTLSGATVTSVTEDVDDEGSNDGTLWTIAVSTGSGEGPLILALNTPLITDLAGDQLLSQGAGGHFVNGPAITDVGTHLVGATVDGSNLVVIDHGSPGGITLVNPTTGTETAVDTGSNVTGVAIAHDPLASYIFATHDAGPDGEGQTTISVAQGGGSYGAPTLLASNLPVDATGIAFQELGTTFTPLSPGIGGAYSAVVTTSSQGLWLVDNDPSEYDAGHPVLLFNPAQQIVAGAAHGTPTIAAPLYDGDPSQGIPNTASYIAYQRDGYGVQVVNIHLGNGYDNLSNGPIYYYPPQDLSYTVGANYGDDRIESFKLADVNGDGTPDLVTLEDDSIGGHPADVTVRLGSTGFGGYGTFETTGETTTVTPADPTSHAGVFAVGDFDGDGKPDLAFSDATGQTISVLHGNGDGTFGAASTITTGVTGDTLKALDAGDLNGDGTDDLVATYADGVLTFDSTGVIQVAPAYTIVDPTVTIGTVTADNIVNAAEAAAPVTISGSTTMVPDGESVTVHVQEGSADVTTTGQVSGGAWSVQLTPTQIAAFADGTVTVTAATDDGTGNAANEAATFTLDRVGPQVAFDPATLDTLNATTAAAGFGLSGTTDAPDGSQLLLTIEDGSGSTVTTAPLTAAGGVWGATIGAGFAQALTDGTYTIAITAPADAAGNPGATASHSLLVDETPQTALFDPATLGTLNKATAATGFTLDGATDVPNGSLVTVTITDPNGVTKLSDAVTATGGAWSDSISAAFAKGLADGTYTLTATASDDAAGNAGLSATRTLIVDETPPTVSIDNVTGDNVVDATEVSAFHVAGSLASDVQSVTFTMRDSAGTVRVSPSTLPVVSGHWDAAIGSLFPSGLASGTYTVEVDATDAAGNTTASTHNFDIHDPQIGVLPVASDNVVDATEAAAGFDVLGLVGGVALGGSVTVQILDPSGTAIVGPLATSVLSSNGTPYWGIHLNAGFTSALADGTYTIKADVQDSAGYAALEAVQTFVVHAPKLAIGTLVGDGIVNLAEAQAGFSVAGTSSGVEDGRTVSVQLLDPSGAMLATYQPTVANGHWSVALDATTATGLADGRYSLTANATDAAGYAAVQATGAFTVDETAPSLAISAVTPDNKVNAAEASTGFAIAGTTQGVENGQPVTLSIVDAQNNVVLNPLQVAVQGGAWSLNGLTAVGLADGSYSVLASARDAAGNVSTQQVQAFTVDETAPSLTVGTVAGDNVVNIAETAAGFTLSGTALGFEAGRTVNVQIATAAGTLVGSGTPIITGGAWSLGVGAGFAQTLADGSYNVFVNATDAAGNPAPQQVHAFTVDRTAPTLTISALTADNTINAAEAAAGFAIAGTTQGVEDNQSVTLAIINSQSQYVLAPVQVAVHNGAWSLPGITAVGLPGGTYGVVAQATDAAGNLSTQQLRTFTVDETAPVLSIDAVTSDDVVNAAEAAAGVALSGSATGLESGRTVSLSIVDAAGQTVVAATPLAVTNGHWGGVLSAAFAQGLADGAYTATVSASDAAGNPALAVSHPFSVDETAPSLTVATLSGDDRISAAEAAAGVTISGTSIGLADGQLVTLRILDDTNAFKLGTTVAVTGNGWSAELPGSMIQALADGTYSVVASATDAAGNPAVQQVHGFTLDQSAPVLGVAAVAGDDQVNAAEATAGLTVGGTALGVEDGRLVDVRIEDAAGSVISAAQASVTDGAWSLPVDGVFAHALADGSYTIVVDATDAAGNAAVEQVHGFTVDQTAPSLDIAAVASDGQVNAAEAAAGFTVGGTATGVEDGRLVTLQIEDSSGAVVATAHPAVTDGAWSLALDGTFASGLADGSYTIVTDAADAAGNPAAQETRGFVVDKTAPVLGIATVAGDDRVNLSEMTAGLGLTGTASGVEDGRSVDVTIATASGTVVQTAQAAVTAGAWSILVDGALADGSYVVTVDATDAAGNAAVQQVHDFTLDQAAPTIALTGPSAPIEATSAAGAAVSFSGSATDAGDGSDAVVFREGTQVVASGDIFGIGTHTLTASAADAAGNTADPLSFTFTIADTTSPVISVSAPTARILTGSAAGAAVHFGGAAADAVDGTDPLVFREDTQVVTSGDVFGLGAHTVTASAMDSAGNAADPVSFAFSVIETLGAGAGDDVYIVNDATDKVFEAPGGGSDIVYTSVSYALMAGQEIERLYVTPASGTDPIRLYGNEFANTLAGNAGANLLNGGGGADLMYGYGGNDIYAVDNADDKVFEAANGGSDIVYTSVSYALQAGQEIERLYVYPAGGVDPINLTGNEFANTLAGNAGANVLNGGAGADLMYGYGGNDVYIVDNAGDRVFEAANGGSDIVYTSVSYALAAGQEIERLYVTPAGGTDPINLTGNEFTNTLAGNAGANVLNGGGGADLMYGYGGNDTYIVDNPGDKVFEAANGGSDIVYTSTSYALQAGQEVERLYAATATGTAAIHLTGNEFANTLVGNAGANVLDGGAGADLMNGLGGNDTYYVDNAGDRVLEASGGGTDTVYASVSYTLAAGQEIEHLYASPASGTTAINLTGNETANTLVGNAGANVLDGGAGADLMYGLGGSDTFVFSTALGTGNVDRIHDFTPSTMTDHDTIELAHTIFTEIAPGVLAATAFVDLASGTETAANRILYNHTTGALSYDADGSGGGAAIQFATLDNHASITLTHSDFYIV